MSQTVKPVTTPLYRAWVVALVLFTVPGCALFGNNGSLSSMIADSASKTGAGKSQSSDDGLLPQSEFDDSMRSDSSGRNAEAPDRLPPAVRLLAPEFADTPESGGPAAVTGSESNPWMSDDTDTDASLAESFSKTVSVSSSNPSFKKDSQLTPMAGSKDAVAETTGAYGPSANTNMVPVPPKPNQERSVLDRLRGLTEPSPERKGSPGFVRRQFEKIPKTFSNPFNFLNGDEEDGSSPPATPPPISSVPNESQGTVPDVSAFSSAAEPLITATADAPTVLIESLTRELRSWPRSNDGIPLQPELYRQREVDLRLARLIADQPAAAAEAIPSMSPHEQEFWQELVLGISQFRSPDQSVAYNDQLSMTVGQLRSAIRQLEPVSSLSMRRLDFCERIHGFGSIESRSSTTFDPGNRMMIYAEVENLATELTDFGTYRTVFSGTLELWAAGGNEAIRKDTIEPNESESTSRRVDYYLSANVKLPSHLPPGEYEMRLTLQDDLNNRQTSGVLKFSVQ